MTRKEVKKEYKKNRKILKKGYRLDKKALKLEKRMLSLSKENYKEKKRNLKINYRNNLQSLMNKYVSTVNEVAKVTKTKDAPYRRTIEEIGNAAAFLLSNLASGITGEICYVDGGFSHVMGLLKSVIFTFFISFSSLPILQYPNSLSPYFLTDKSP